MFKFIIIFALVWLLFILFKNKKKMSALKEVVKCDTCNEIIAKDKAIIIDDKNYCSKACI